MVLNSRTVHRITTPIFLIVGLTVLITVIHQWGTAELLASFKRVGFRIGYVLALPLSWYLIQTLAWYFILEETGTHVSYGHLLKIKLGGESVNTMTPVGFMVGDPVRLYLLQKRMPVALSTASIVLDRTMITVAVVSILFVGLFVAWITLDLPDQWRFILPVFTFLLAIGMVIVVHRQKRGAFQALTRLLMRLGIKRPFTESVQEKIRDLDERIMKFYHHSPRRFWAVYGLHFLGRFLGAVEIFLIASLLAIPLKFSGALVLVSLSILINSLFTFIPGGMGIMEGAYGGLLQLMGLDPITGVALQLMRRVRALFWILTGLLIVGLSVRSKKVVPKGTQLSSSLPDTEG